MLTVLWWVLTGSVAIRVDCAVMDVDIHVDCAVVGVNRQCCCAG